MRCFSLIPPIFRFTFFLVVLFSLTAMTLLAQSKTTISVSPETTVSGERVLLSEIAEISGSDEVVKKLKNISLGYSPNVGLLREINRSQILLAISAAGFPDSEIILDAPPKTLIRRAGQTITREQLREVIEKSLTEKFADQNLEVQIKRIETPENILAPQGSIEIRPNFSAIQNHFQPFTLPLEIVVDGKIWRRLSASVEIEAFFDVLVAKQDLAANSNFSANDCVIAKRKINKPLSNYYRDTANLRGLTLVKNVSAGTEITSDLFVLSVVIKSGDAVRIEAQSGKLKIVVSGEARASGRIGDRIAVKNLQSGAVLQAFVVDEGLVRINF